MSSFVALSAVVPSLLLLWFFHSRDTFREPTRVLWTTFGLGIASIAPTLAIAWPLDTIADSFESPLWYGTFSAFLVAAFPEELFKLAALLWYANRHLEFDEPIDGIVYGVSASLGFATFENLLYVSDGGLEVAFIRSLTAVPGHACCGAIMGYYIGRRKFAETGRRRLLLAGYLLPVLLHGLYDLPILAAQKADEIGSDLDSILIVTPLVLLFEIALTLRMLRTLRAEQRDRHPSLPPVPVTASTTPEPAPTPTPRRAQTGWAMLMIGALAASAGGLVMLGILVGILLEPQTGELAELLLGGVIIGVIPAVLGLVLFAAGLRRLNRATASRASPAVGSKSPQ